jgi:hypothetical protein
MIQSQKYLVTEIEIFSNVPKYTESHLKINGNCTVYHSKRISSCDVLKRALLVNHSVYVRIFAMKKQTERCGNASDIKI